MRRRPELMQFEIGMSTMRYLPASGTAGLARSLVSGNKRVPCPPPIMTESTLLVLIVCRPVCDITKIPFARKFLEGKLYAAPRTGKAQFYVGCDVNRGQVEPIGFEDGSCLKG